MIWAQSTAVSEGIMYQASVVAELECLMGNMTQREQIAFLLSVGVPAVDVMGTTTCFEHMGGRELQDYEGLTFDGATVWCKSCCSWWAI